MFHSICKLIEIVNTRTTAYRPHSNGQIERYNRTLVAMVRFLLNRNIKNSDKYLPYIASAIRSVQNRHTGFSSNRLMLGRETRKPVDILYGVQPPSSKEGKSEGEYLTQLDSVKRAAHKLAKDAAKDGSMMVGYIRKPISLEILYISSDPV